MPVWLPSQDEPLPSSNCAIRVGDKGWWSVQASQFIARTLLSSPLTLGRLAEDGMPSSSGSVFQAPPLLGSGPPTHPSYSIAPLSPLLGTLPPLQALPSPSWGGETKQPPPQQLSQPSSPVPYDICRPDHSVLTLQLPVTASVREVMAALAQEDGWTKGQVLVKVNSAGGELCLWVGWPQGRGPPQSRAHPPN